MATSSGVVVLPMTSSKALHLSSMRPTIEQRLDTLWRTSKRVDNTTAADAELCFLGLLDVAPLPHQGRVSGGSSGGEPSRHPLARKARMRSPNVRKNIPKVNDSAIHNLKRARLNPPINTAAHQKTPEERCEAEQRNVLQKNNLPGVSGESLQNILNKIKKPRSTRLSPIRSYRMKREISRTAKQPHGSQCTISSDESDESDSSGLGISESDDEDSPKLMPIRAGKGLQKKMPDFGTSNENLDHSDSDENDENDSEDESNDGEISNELTNENECRSDVEMKKRVDNDDDDDDDDDDDEDNDDDDDDEKNGTSKDATVSSRDAYKHVNKKQRSHVSISVTAPSDERIVTAKKKIHSTTIASTTLSAPSSVASVSTPSVAATSVHQRDSIHTGSNNNVTNDTVARVEDSTCAHTQSVSTTSPGFSPDSITPSSSNESKARPKASKWREAIRLKRIADKLPSAQNSSSDGWRKKQELYMQAGLKFFAAAEAQQSLQLFLDTSNFFLDIAQKYRSAGADYLASIAFECCAVAQCQGFTFNRSKMHRNVTRLNTILKQHTQDAKRRRLSPGDKGVNSSSISPGTTTISPALAPTSSSPASISPMMTTNTNIIDETTLFHLDTRGQDLLSSVLRGNKAFFDYHTFWEKAKETRPSAETLAQHKLPVLMQLTPNGDMMEFMSHVRRAVSTGYLA